MKLHLFEHFICPICRKKRIRKYAGQWVCKKCLIKKSPYPFSEVRK